MLYIGILLQYNTKVRQAWALVGLWNRIEGIRFNSGAYFRMKSMFDARVVANRVIETGDAGEQEE